MKRFLSIILCVMLMLTMVFSLASCSFFEDIFSGIFPPGDNTPGDNTLGGNTSGGNTPGGETPTEGVLATLGNNYKIDLTYSAEKYGDTIIEREVFAANNGAYLYRYFYSDSEAERTMLIKDGYRYGYNEYVGFFSSCSTKDIEDNIEDYVGWAKLIRISNDAQKIEFTDQENTTFLGRPCVKYINKKHVDASGWLSAYDVDAYYIVDNATKLCLKYENTTKVYNENGAISDEGREFFEITEFAVGSVNINDMLAKIKFNEWVSADYLSERGLTNVAAPVGTFVNYYLNCDEDTKVISSYSGTYIMTEANARVLCDALYDAGVKYDWNDFTTVKPKNEIYRESTDEDGNPVSGYFSFQGYTSKGTFLNVYGDIQDDGTYEMTIAIG